MDAWMLRIAGRKKYWGNQGYENDPRGIYSFDSDTANSRRIKTNDFVLIRESDLVTGLSRIDHIVISPGEKDLTMCPVCNSKRPVKRTTLFPEWKCNNGHTFSQPKIKSVPVTKFEASFSKRYYPLDTPLQWQEFKSFFHARSTHSIRKLNLEKTIASHNPIFGEMRNVVRTLAAAQEVSFSNRQEHHDAANKLREIIEFLNGCRGEDDGSQASSNKLPLPLNEQTLERFKRTLVSATNDLSGSSDSLAKVSAAKEDLGLKQRFLRNFIDNAGKHAGEQAVKLGKNLIMIGAAKLLGLIDAALAALSKLPL